MAAKSNVMQPGKSMVLSNTYTYEVLGLSFDLNSIYGSEKMFAEREMQKSGEEQKRSRQTMDSSPPTSMGVPQPSMMGGPPTSMNGPQPPMMGAPPTSMGGPQPPMMGGPQSSYPGQPMTGKKNYILIYLPS